MDLKLKGKRVLVTGGNSGIDAAFARGFAAEGAHLVVNYLVNPVDAEALGIGGPRMLSWEADPKVWSKVIDINLKGAFLCARQALRQMVAQKSGVLLNTSSVTDYPGFAHGG